MTKQQVTIAPGLGPKPLPAVFVDGVQLRGVLQILANEGAAVMILLDPANVAIDPVLVPAPLDVSARPALPTDGAA